MSYGRHLSNALSCAHETFKGLIPFRPVSSQEDSFYLLEWWVSEQCRYRVDMKYSSCFAVFLSSSAYSSTSSKLIFPLFSIFHLTSVLFFFLFPCSISYRSFFSHLSYILNIFYFTSISFCPPPSRHRHHSLILFILRFLLYPGPNCTSRSLISYMNMIRIGWKDKADIANVAVLTAVTLRITVS